MGVYWNPSNKMSGYYRSLEKSAQNVVLQTQGASGSFGKVSTPTGIGYYVDASGHQTGAGSTPTAGEAAPKGEPAISTRLLDREVKARLDETEGRVGALALAQILRESGITPDYPLTARRGLARQLSSALSAGKLDRDLAPLVRLISAGHRPALAELLKQR